MKTSFWFVSIVTLVVVGIAFWLIPQRQVEVKAPPVVVEQPVKKPVVKPVEKPAEDSATWYNPLSWF